MISFYLFVIFFGSGVFGSRGGVGIISVSGMVGGAGRGSRIDSSSSNIFDTTVSINAPLVLK